MASRRSSVMSRMSTIAAQAVQTVKANPELVEKVQADMLSYVERMAPIIDKMAAMEQALGQKIHHIPFSAEDALFGAAYE